MVKFYGKGRYKENKMSKVCYFNDFKNDFHNCPCFNLDNEYCQLGFDTKEIILPKAGKYISDECELSKIVLNIDEEILPKEE